MPRNRVVRGIDQATTRSMPRALSWEGIRMPPRVAGRQDGLVPTSDDVHSRHDLHRRHDHDHGLRPLRPEDAPAVLAAYRSATDMARQGTVTTLQQARTQVSWLLAEDRQATAIVDREDTLVGLVAISID